jgi:hypothetical protein
MRRMGMDRDALMKRGMLPIQRAALDGSEAGSRFAERLLTVVGSCRQQGRPLLALLVAAGEAAVRGGPPPSVLLALQEDERLLHEYEPLVAWCHCRGARIDAPHSSIGHGGGDTCAFFADRAVVAF